MAQQKLEIGQQVPATGRTINQILPSLPLTPAFGSLLWTLSGLAHKDFGQVAEGLAGLTTSIAVEFPIVRNVSRRGKRLTEISVSERVANTPLVQAESLAIHMGAVDLLSDMFHLSEKTRFSSNQMEYLQFGITKNLLKQRIDITEAARVEKGDKTPKSSLQLTVEKAYLTLNSLQTLYLQQHQESEIKSISINRMADELGTIFGNFLTDAGTNLALDSKELISAQAEESDSIQNEEIKQRLALLKGHLQKNDNIDYEKLHAVDDAINTVVERYK